MTNNEPDFKTNCKDSQFEDVVMNCEAISKKAIEELIAWRWKKIPAKKVNAGMLPAQRPGKLLTRKLIR